MGAAPEDVDVEVDQPRDHQPVAGVDDLLAGPGREGIADLGDAPVGEPHVARGVEPLARIDDRPAPDQHRLAASRPVKAGITSRANHRSCS